MIEEITIYTTPNCKYCQEAKNIISKYFIEYNEINLKKKENRKAREFYRSLGIKTAPVIVIKSNGEEIILSEYDSEMLEEMIESA